MPLIAQTQSSIRIEYSAILISKKVEIIQNYFVEKFKKGFENFLKATEHKIKNCTRKFVVF